jgi:hypothetical protein
MPRTLLACAALAILALPSRADQTITPNETVIRLTVQPMAAPKPALRYLLLPELRELSPGNPIPNYLKCLLEQEASGRETTGRAALRQADRAARLDKPDWQILLKIRTEGVNLLLPDVQKIRALANALQKRFNEEVAQHRFDDALVTAKTMFAMSRHMAEHPTLIGDLVGIAIAFVAINPLEEMLEQSGCPNLYWALTNLPNPLISVEKGMEGERLFIVAEFHDLDDRAPMSAEQIQKVIEHIDRIRAFDEGGRWKKTRAWLDARVPDEQGVRAACRRLVEAGLPEERVLRFPADQVILLDELRDFEARRDEVLKLVKLSTWQFEALFAQVKQAQKPAPLKALLPALERVRDLLGPQSRWTGLVNLLIAHVKSERDPSLFGSLLPAMEKVRRAQGRLEQRVALLRHVEALRLYAAEHEGKLPAHLADVAVPLPDNPFTGKPFAYTVDGATAHLRGSGPPGEEQNPAYNLHYEITIQK